MKKFLFVIIIFSWALALAQSSDSLLQSYSLAMESLDQAINVIEEDAAVAQEALVRAQITLRPMSVDSSSHELVQALETTFDNAKIAIRNKSADDLFIQSSVLKGGYWRLLYESVINSSDANPAILKSYLLRMAKDMKLPEVFIVDIESYSDLLTLIANFEKTIAEESARYISLAANAEDSGEAYRQLAIAYSLFLPVQDSPRAVSATNNLFARAFQEIVNDDKESLDLSLAKLLETMTDFSAASSQFLGQAPALTNASVNMAVTNTTANTENLAVENLENTNGQATVSSTATTEATTETTQPTIPQPTAASDLLEATNSATAAVNMAVNTVTNTANTVTSTNNAQPSTNSTLVVAEVNNTDQAILTAFKSHGIKSSAQQQSLLRKYHTAGVAHPSDLQDVFFAQSARIAVALESGDQVKAKRLLVDMRKLYSELLAPLNRFHNEATAEQTIKLMDNLIKAPGLRVQDAIVLAGQLGTTAHGVSSVPLMHKAIVSTTNIWAGWIRLIFATIFGILAFVPLYLLVLAFGGGNKNWQLVGWSLFLLLLPMIYEGLSYLASLLASLTGLQVLNSLSSFSIFQNGLSQAIWFVLSGIAIILAIAGLYGICVQFGLLGNRSQSGGKTTILEPSVTETAVQTNFDWDEEF